MKRLVETEPKFDRNEKEIKMRRKMADLRQRRNKTDGNRLGK